MPASWWGQETPGWSGHFCCLSAAVCGNLKPRLIAKDPWQVTNTWDNLRLFNTFRNKIRNIWKHIIMRWPMGWCKGTCARKTMFVYMFYTMVLAPIRSFSLFFSLQFSRLSWSRRSQGTHFHQVIGICDAAAASDPQCFSMGSIFFIKKNLFYCRFRTSSTIFEDLFWEASRKWWPHVRKHNLYIGTTSDHECWIYLISLPILILQKDHLQ